MLWACERLCCIFDGEMLDYPHWERTSFLLEILLLGWESRRISQMNPLRKFTEQKNAGSAFGSDTIHGPSCECLTGLSRTGSAL